jgi:type IV pilus assembly protein PilV
MQLLHIPSCCRSTPRHYRQANPGARKARGFSMVEVLVSIVVLSFGLLGMVGMQASALKSNREARLQSTAITLARELAEMIRGNKAVGILPAATNPYLGSFNTTPLVANTPFYCLSVGTTACANATEVANAQMTEWLARVEAELPGARVSSCYDTAPFDANGLPQWTCTAGTGREIMVKIGWTRGSTDRSKSGLQALDRATTPAIVFPVTAGQP